LVSVKEAVALVKDNATAKFDETIEISLALGVDPRHADQMVRGTVDLPNGTGKSVRVAVFARGEKADEAKAAGADIVGAEDLTEQIEQNLLAFVDAVAKAKPAGAKGTYMKKISVSSTMGPGVSLNVDNATGNA